MRIFLGAVLCIYVMLVVPVVVAKPAAQPVVEIYQTSITQQILDDMKESRNIISPDVPQSDYDSEFIWNTLSLAVYNHEANARSFAPDASYVRKKTEAKKTSLTDTQYEAMKEAEKVVSKLRTEFSASKANIDSFVKDVWASRGPELQRLNIASSPADLRSYLLLLNAPETGSVQPIGSRRNSLPQSKDEFFKQVNNPANNKSFWEQMSRIEQVKNAVVGKVTCSPDEVARGKEYFQQHEANLSKRKSYVSGGLNGLLVELKKENQTDRWLMKKLKQDANFHDPAIQRGFTNWEAKARPRHRDLFGPFSEHAK